MTEYEPIYKGAVDGGGELITLEQAANDVLAHLRLTCPDLEHVCISGYRQTGKGHYVVLLSNGDLIRMSVDESGPPTVLH